MHDARFMIHTALLFGLCLLLVACADEAPTAPKWVDDDSGMSVLTCDVGKSVKIPIEFAPGPDDLIAVANDHTIEGKPTTMVMPYSIRTTKDDLSLVINVTDSTRSGALSVFRNGKKVYSAFLKVMEDTVDADSVVMLWHPITITSAPYDSIVVEEHDGKHIGTYVVDSEPFAVPAIAQQTPSVNITQYRDRDGHYLYSSTCGIKTPGVRFSVQEGQLLFRLRDFVMPPDLQVFFEVGGQHGATIFQEAVIGNNQQFRVFPTADSVVTCRLRSTLGTHTLATFNADTFAIDTVNNGWYDLSISLPGRYLREHRITYKREGSSDSIVTTTDNTAQDALQHRTDVWGTRSYRGVTLRLDRSSPVPESLIEGTVDLFQIPPDRASIILSVQHFIGPKRDTAVTIKIQQPYARVTRQTDDTIMVVIDNVTVLTSNYVSWVTGYHDAQDPNRSVTSTIIRSVGGTVNALTLTLIRRRD